MNGASTNNVKTRNRSRRSSLATRSPNNAVARTTVPLVATLNSAFSRKSEFTLTTLMIDRQNSPELAAIKAKVEAIPRTEFQTLTNFNNHLQKSNSRLENYQRDLALNLPLARKEPKLKQANQAERVFHWLKEEREFFSTGGSEIIDRHAQEIEEHILSTENEAERLKLKIEAIQILRERTNYWKGFWDAVKDKLPPKFSDAGGNLLKPLLVLFQWAADNIVCYIAYNKVWEKEQLLEVLKTWEAMFNEDLKAISKTKDEMDKYHKTITKAESLWIEQVYAVWVVDAENTCGTMAIIRLERYIHSINAIQNRLSLTNKPFEQALSLIHPFYGSGLSVQRNVANFCRDVPYISRYLKKLLTAKGIICDTHAEKFEDDVYRLARLIYGRLERIEDLCTRRNTHIDPGKLSTFLEEDSADFIRHTDRIIEAMKNVLGTQIHEKKTSKTLKKRMDGDRRYQHWSWRNRPLVTPTSAVDVLQDLQLAIDTIHRVSLSIGTGTNMLSTEELVDVQRSHVEFNRSDSLLGEFFRVLREEIVRGSNDFPERSEKVTETTTPHKKFGLSRLTAKLRRSKPEAPKGVLESA